MLIGFGSKLFLILDFSIHLCPLMQSMCILNACDNMCSVCWLVVATNGTPNNIDEFDLYSCNISSS